MLSLPESYSYRYSPFNLAEWHPAGRRIASSLSFSRINCSYPHSTLLFNHTYINFHTSRKLLQGRTTCADYFSYAIIAGVCVVRSGSNTKSSSRKAHHHDTGLQGNLDNKRTGGRVHRSVRFRENATYSRLCYW